jgi:endonuclease YncB( thermonuclease family)
VRFLDLSKTGASAIKPLKNHNMDLQARLFDRLCVKFSDKSPSQMNIYGLILGLWLASQGATAETLSGRVVGISDGDTLTVLVEKRHVKVRIKGIDAPEKGQPFAERSKQNLARMAFQKDARLECHKKDQYGREVCKVWVQPSDCPTCGKTLDVGHAQVIAGMAWWFRKYIREQTLEDGGRYESSEEEARLRRLGLWNDPQPIPPWEWRRQEWEKRDRSR